MAMSEARKRANEKWNKENMTTLSCKVRKEYAENVRKSALEQGLTVNSIFKAALDDFMGGNSDYIKITIPPDAEFTIEKVEAAADSCGQSVQEWVKEAIMDKL